MKRCEHGIYLSEADVPSGRSWGCSSCFPDGHPEATQVPVLPRSAADSLMQKIVLPANCTKCGNVRTYCTPNCRVCGTLFPEVDFNSQGGPSNKKQPGSCPECGSNVHFEVRDNLGRVSKTKWECSECCTKFHAPKMNDEDEQ